MNSRITDDVMKSFVLRTQYRSYNPNFDKRVGSLKFSGDGDFLIAASNEGTIELYDCNTGKQKVVFSKKYGSGLCDFSKGHTNILVTSIKRGHSVREINIPNNKYENCFFGHTDLVTALAVRAKDGIFLTGSKDKTIRLWDINTPLATARVENLGDEPLVSWFPNGQAFVVGLKSKTLSLYDIRGIGYGPFMENTLNDDTCKWTSLKCSSDGKQILISTDSNKVRVMDSDRNKVLRVYGGRKNTIGIPIDASFTSDSNYILTGSSDGYLHIYTNHESRSADDKQIAEISSGQIEAITQVEMNPKYALIATASSYVGLWVPRD